MWFLKTTTDRHTLAQVKDVRPRTGHESPQKGEGTGIALLFLQPGREMRVGGEHHVPAVLPRGREAVPILQRVEWTPGPVWTGFKP